MTENNIMLKGKFFFLDPKTYHLHVGLLHISMVGAL